MTYRGGSTKAYWPRIGVGNTDYRLIQRLIDLTKITSVRYVIPKSIKHKEQWHWRVDRRDDVVAILKSVLPYLVIKIEQAKAILSLPNRNAKNKEAREKVHSICMQLNKRGPRAA